jgi:peptidoglycan L-alanyl-D-glutamate endopeptidase CwlK
MTLKQAAERSRGHIERLEPTFGARVAKWYSELLDKKIPALIYCSIRTPEEQEELYARGRTKPGTKVTNARGTPAQSLHIHGKAIDAVPLARSSTGEYFTAWDDELTYGVMRKIGEKHGLRFLEWETPHFEDANVSGWRELVLIPKKEIQKAVNKKTPSIAKKNPWSSR